MIIFLNFTPIDFMGGAEKLMAELANVASKKDEVVMLDVSPMIANIYGRLVLKRTFKSHISDHDISKKFKHISLAYKDFIPFTKNWFHIRKLLRTTDLIYARYEILEIGILIYFGGINVFKKTIAGLHLSPFYIYPRGIMDKFHNLVYESSLYKGILRNTKRIHVLNNRDYSLLTNKYKLKNVEILPAGIKINNNLELTSKQNKNKLNIIFVGELSTRKGVDTLCKIIAKSPNNFIYNIIGDGPLKNDIVKLENEKKCIYHGYISDEKLQEFYAKSDVLLFPSRAEAFGIVMAEAAAFGLKIVNSTEVSLHLPNYIEYSISDRNENKYIHVLQKILVIKSAEVRKKIRKYAINNYSDVMINKKFVNNILAI